MVSRKRFWFTEKDRRAHFLHIIHLYQSTIRYICVCVLTVGHYFMRFLCDEIDIMGDDLLLRNTM